MNSILWKFMVRITHCVMTLLALLSPPLNAKMAERPPMPAGYNDAGPSPDSVLPKIIARLQTELKDPYSIRDFTLCQPKRIEAYYGLNWVRAHWSVTISLNSKNGFGGYTGSTVYYADFENGEATKITQFKGIAYVPQNVNVQVLAQLRSCPKVPDSEIQKLLQ